MEATAVLNHSQKKERSRTPAGHLWRPGQPNIFLLHFKMLRHLRIIKDYNYLEEFGYPNSCEGILAKIVD
jgi:hypothetical protein